MTTQQEFKNQKEQGQAVLEKLQGFLEQGKDFELFGISVDDSLEKLQKAKDKINQSKLKVVFIGGFSEGKTSIASAWLGKVVGKIDSAESSDEVAFYDTKDDEIEIFDTPGLFGFKEKGQGVNAEKYKDITKKFVSEADIILYVMNPTNPIKASHKEDLEWLFRTLNLLPRTIFVLSKFDEVADMGDEADFESEFATKKDKSIIPSLSELIKLNANEKAQLKVVAVSANPEGKGLDFWLNNQSEFKKLSHIDLLQNATTEIIKQNGGLESITLEAQNSIVSDIVSKQLPQAITLQNKIKGDMQRLNESQEALKKDMERTNDKINDAQMALREFVARYFNDLIRQIKGTSLETFDDIFYKEIGNEGNQIVSRVKNEFQRHTHSVISELQISIERFDKERGDFEQAISRYSKNGVEWLKEFANPKSVKMTRDLIKMGLDKMGVNVGNLLNFKPWGAIKLANGLGAFLSALGFVLEVWDTVQRAKIEKEFSEGKKEMENALDKQRKELSDIIENNEKFYALFSGYEPLKNALEDTQKDLQTLESISAEFEKWIKQGEIIEAEIVE